MGFVVKLHLGIVDVPEVASNIGTYDLAVILEAKYSLMSQFAKQFKPFIVQSLSQSLAAQISLLAAGRTPADPFAEGTDKITRRFQDALNEQFMDGQPGVPTKMALMNKSRVKGARRRSTASFIDQGIFQSQLRTWVAPT